MSNSTTSAIASTSAAETISSASSAPATSSILSTSISSEISSTIVNTPTSAAETSATPAAALTSSTPAPAPAPESTSTVSLSSIPPTTEVVTSVIIATSIAGQTNAPVTVVITRTNQGTQVPITAGAPTGRTSSTSTQAALNTGASSGNNNGGGGGGLSTAGITAIAVVVPLVAVALLVLAGILLWRKRKQKKQAEEARRKEVEDYGFNPNNDPTLPAVASESGHEMSEDNSGYRGWGVAGGNRKMSTTLTSGHTQGQLSDAGSNPYKSGGTPPGPASDGYSGDAMLAQRRETMNSDDLGSLGQGPVAGANQGQMKRGPSNASSTYSAANHSDTGSDGQPGSMPQSYDAYNPVAGSYGYGQHGPYGDGTYGGAAGPDMPIVQDVSARRNTRIQQPGNYQQGNSGIAQNF